MFPVPEREKSNFSFFLFSEKREKLPSEKGINFIINIAIFISRENWRVENRRKWKSENKSGRKKINDENVLLPSPGLTRGAGSFTAKLECLVSIMLIQ